MRKFFSAVSVMFLFVTHMLGQQKVGIGTQAPLAMLSVNKDIMVDRAGAANHSLNSGALIFGPEYKVGIASSRSVGSFVKMGMDFYTGGQARMHIDSLGNVGIGTIDPGQKLSVVGHTYLAGRLGISNPVPAYGLDVNDYSHFNNNVGIRTIPTAGYSLDVVGAVRIQDDMRVNGILNPNNALAIGNNTTIEGTLTVQNGKGIVRSTSAAQMKMKRISVFFSATGFGPGATLTSGFLGFGEDFSSVSVAIGNCTTPEEPNDSWSKVLIVPFDVDVVNNRCRFKVTNTSSSTISFSGHWDVILVGS